MCTHHTYMLMCTHVSPHIWLTSFLSTWIWTPNSKHIQLSMVTSIDSWNLEVWNLEKS